MRSGHQRGRLLQRISLERSAVPSLQGLASGVAVVYVGTFSKVMFPDLRIGYVIAPPALVPFFTRAKWLADTQTPMLEQAALADFLAEGYMERHIRRMRRSYGLRRRVLLDSLNQHFGKRVQILGDAAGMHTLVRVEDRGIGQSSPIQPKALPVPSDDGLRFHNAQGGAPIGPNSGEPDPNESVARRNRRRRFWCTRCNKRS